MTIESSSVESISLALPMIAEILCRFSTHFHHYSTLEKWRAGSHIERRTEEDRKATSIRCSSEESRTEMKKIGIHYANYISSAASFSARGAIEETGKFIQFRPESYTFKLLPKCYILIHFQPDAESADDKELHNCYLRAIFFSLSFFFSVLLSQLLSTIFLVSHSLSFECLYNVLLAVQSESC